MQIHLGTYCKCTCLIISDMQLSLIPFCTYRARVRVALSQAWSRTHHLFAQHGQRCVKARWFTAAKTVAHSGLADVRLDARPLAVDLLNVPPGASARVQDTAQSFR